ncbi:MAG: hypothetical protein ACI8TX_003156 [Hyphomicrobiaceae bacterium]|jgi:hypothetical protein
MGWATGPSLSFFLNALHAPDVNHAHRAIDQVAAQGRKDKIYAATNNFVNAFFHWHCTLLLAVASRPSCR